MTNERAVAVMLGVWMTAVNANAPETEVFRLAIDALNKQCPQKVKRKRKSGFTACPACGTLVDLIETEDLESYCYKCGQKLDWRGK